MVKKKSSQKDRRSSVKDRLRNVKDVATWVDASQPARKQKEETRPERHVRYETESVSSGSTTSTLIEKAKALDGGYAWIVTAYSFFLHFIADGITFSFGMIFHDIIHRFKVARWAASTVGSVFLSFPLILGPIASIITDQFGCRNSILTGLSLSTTGALLAALALHVESVILFLIGFGVILGTGLSFVYNAAIVIVTLYFENKMGTATSIAVSGTGVGTIVFPQIINLLVVYFAGYSTTVLCLGIGFMCFVSYVIGKFWIRDPEWTSDDVEYKRKMFDRRVRKLDRERNDDDDIEIDDDGLQRRAYSLPNMSKLCQMRGSIIDLGVSLQSIKDTVNMSIQAEPPVPRSRSVGTFMRKTLAVIPEYTMITQDELGHLDHLDLHLTSSPANTIHSKPRIRMLSKTSMSVDAINDLSEFDDEASNVKIGFYSESEEDELDDHDHESSSESDSEMSNDGESSESDLSDRILNKTIKVPNGVPVAEKVESARKPESARLPRPSLPAVQNAPGRVYTAAYRSRVNTNMIAFQAKMPSAPLLPHQKKKWYMKYDMTKKLVPALIQIPLQFPGYLRLMKEDRCFLLFVLSVSLLYAVLDVPYVFFYDYAVDTLQITEENAKDLPSVIGLCNLISTWLIGFLADTKIMKNRLFLIYAVCMFGAAGFMFASSYATTLTHMTVVCAGFGFCISSNYVMQSILLSNMFGEDSNKFISAYAFSSHVEGLATLIGPPIVGFIRDQTGDYKTVFCFSGGIVFISGILSLVIHVILRNRRSSRKSSKDYHEHEMALLKNHA